MRWFALLALLLAADAHALVYAGGPGRMVRHRRAAAAPAPADPCGTLSTLIPGATLTRASTATYWPCTNPDTLATAAAGEARVEESGVLVEGARTNLLPNTEDLTSWTKQYVSVTTGPDGWTTLLSTYGGKNVHYVYQGTSKINVSSTYTASLDARPGTTSSLFLNPGGGMNDFPVYYDVDTCTVTTAHASVVSAGTMRLPDGACRVFATYTGAIVCNMQIGPANGTSNSYNGSSLNLSVDVRRPQHEQGATPSSYIPTTGTPVTRAADNVERPNSISGPTWALAITATPGPGRTWTATDNPALLAIGAASGANRASLAVDTGALRLTVADAAGAERYVTATAPSAGQHRVVACSTDGALAIYVDGALASGEAAGAGTGQIGAQPSTIHVGSIAGTRHWNGHLRDLRVCSSCAECL